MTLKLIGAILVIAACGGVGASMVRDHKREEKGTSELIQAIDLMSCELEQHLTPLPQLCRMVAENGSGIIGRVFMDLSSELDKQVGPSVSLCMAEAIRRNTKLTTNTRNLLEQLGATLGRFDLNGQIKGLEAVKRSCLVQLDHFTKNRDVRLRSYQTLGLCAGAALAIIFL